MSNYDTQHAHQHGRPLDYSGGSGKGLWIGLGLVVVLALVGLGLWSGGSGTADSTTPPALGSSGSDPAVITPAPTDPAPSGDTAAPN